TGSYITAVGTQADVSVDGLTNATAIGYGATVDVSNKVRIGNSAVTVIEGQVPFTTPSDGRYKFNVEENVKGLDFILHLRPVTYQFDVKRFDAHMQHQPGKEDGAGNYALQAGYDEATRIRRSGFIAQEVEQAANASGYDFSGIIKPKTDADHYSLSYDAFVVPLVKAVQEQQQIILQQNKKLDEQEKRLSSLQTQLDELKKLLQPAN
ncbi:MAG TPA: tail fiber domain-containing protein, partial [Puia sp.]|nr:tail fiber domain-containing protein [Puia sp.]